MREDEAREAVGYLKTQFTGLPLDTAQFWYAEFLRHPAQVVRTAIDEIARECGTFLAGDYRPKLLKLINTRSSPSPEPKARFADVRLQALANLQREREQRAATMAAFERIDRRLAELADQELEDLKTHVLGGLNAGAQTVLARSDPKSSRWLRSLIYDVLQQREQTV